MLGHDGDVGPGLFATFLGRAHAVTNIQPQVPQHGEELLQNLIGRTKAFIRIQDQQVDVGMGQQFRPSVTSDGHQGQSCRCVAQCLGPDVRQGLVDQARVRADQCMGGDPCIEIRGDEIAAPGQHIAQGSDIAAGLGQALIQLARTDDVGLVLNAEDNRIGLH